MLPAGCDQERPGSTTRTRDTRHQASGNEANLPDPMEAEMGLQVMHSYALMI